MSVVSSLIASDSSFEQQQLQLDTSFISSGPATTIHHIEQEDPHIVPPTSPARVSPILSITTTSAPMTRTNISAPFEAAAAAAALQQHHQKQQQSNSGGTKGGACRPVAEFLFHLTRMLSDPSNHHLIEWDAGRIVVHDPPSMETEVLGKYFRHSKYSSFQRQLNYFGFKKISGKGKMSPCSYINDAATADLGCLLNIKRKTATKGIEKREREAALAAAKAAKSGGSKTGKSSKSGKSGRGTSSGKNGKPSSPKRIRVRKSSSSSKSKSKSIAVVSQVDMHAPMQMDCEYSQSTYLAQAQANASWAPPTISNVFGDHLSTDFDPFVVSAEEFGPPGIVHFQHHNHGSNGGGHHRRSTSQVTPSTSASSSSSNLVAMGSGCGSRPAENLCLPPPATSALETSFHQALKSQQHQNLLQKALDVGARQVQQVPSQPQAQQAQQAEHKEEEKKSVDAPFSVPNPLMSVPNPLMAAGNDDSQQPSPTTVAAVPTSMPSPATAAMNASNTIASNNHNNNVNKGGTNATVGDNDDDLSAGFPSQPTLSSAHQTIAQMLSTTIPDATDLFSSTAHLPSKLGGAAYPGMLSPNSSLVNLAMLPTL